MPRYLAPVALGLLYVVVAAWVVRSEGIAYRQALRQARTPAQDRAAPPLPEAPAMPEPPATPEAPAPKPAPPPVKDDPPPVIEPERSPAELAAPVEPAPPPPSMPEPTPKPKPAPPPPATPAPAPKVVETLALSPEGERQLGREVHELILSRHKAVEGGPWLRQVTEVARPLLRARSRRDIDYQFTILDSDDVNAFSHLGGYLYVTRGLFDLIADDSELAFVLAHEIAHVDKKHGLKAIDQARGEAERLGAGTAQAVCHAIAAGYSEDQEYEADRWALDQLRRQGHSRRECLAFLRKFAGYAENHGFENGRKPPKTDLAAPVQDVENHFRSQPAAWSRLDRLKEAFDGSK